MKSNPRKERIARNETERKTWEIEKRISALEERGGYGPCRICGCTTTAGLCSGDARQNQGRTG